MQYWWCSMEELWITLPAYAPDYSGVCSAMFELGGLCVIHDASGCTGNYTGYDEPRWYGSTSKVFCSGLREIDAVLGQDDKLINNILEAGKLINPTMYTVIGSPVPMIIGTDTKGIACEIEEKTGVPSFGFDTNGLGLYNKGISEAMCELIKRFTLAPKEKVKRGVNILGTTPLDLSANSNAQDLKERLEEWGFKVIGQMMMGATIWQLENLANAQLNLVVTESGLAAAQLLERKYHIPYVVGMPLGQEEDVRELMEQALASGTSAQIQEVGEAGGVLIVGEQVLGNSLRRMLKKKAPHTRVTVATLTGLNKKLASEGDINVPGEETLLDLINSNHYHTLIGDPLMEELIGEASKVKFVALPHVALSSKLHWNNVPRLLTEEIDTLAKAVL